MAKEKKLTKHDVTNFFGRIKKVNIRGPQGGILREITSPDDLMDFVSDQDNRRVIDHYQHEVIPSNINKKDNVESATKGYKRLVERLSGKRNIPVTYGGEAKEKYGIRLMEQKSAVSKLLGELDERKDDVVNRTSNDNLLDIARRKDAGRYHQILVDNELGEHSTSGEKAEVIREFVRNRKMGKSGRTPDGYASAIVWDAAKGSDDVKRDNRFGSDAYDDIDKVLGRDRSTQGAAKKIIKKSVMKKYGPKDSASRNIFNEIKRGRGFNTDLETMRYMETPEGKEDQQNILIAKTRSGKMKQSTARSLQNKLKLPGGPITTEEFKVDTNLRSVKQKQLVGSLLGYSGASGAQSLGAKILHKKLSSDPDALRALQKGDEETVRSKLPESISYNELHTFKGKEPTVQEVKHLKQAGVEVSGLPPVLEDKLAGTYYDKPSGKGRGRPSLGGGRASSDRYVRGRGATFSKSGGSLVGTEEISYVGGKPVIRKKQGRISAALSGAGGRVKGKFTPKKRDKEKIYRQLKDRADLKYLTDEELKYAAYSGYAARQNAIRKGKRMLRDPAYRARTRAKQEERKGIYEAKLAKAMKDSERRKRAAVSPWWKAWYTISHNMYVLIGIVLAISILFLPIGMFHVLGWALAVGIVSLVLFIVWVFVELWWLIAQALVALINFMGQAIVGIVNWIGGAFAGLLGQSFTPFEHTLVQNMNLVQRDPVTGERTVLGITWGTWNLVPPSFLKLDEFMPRTFDTDTIITKIFPAIRDFFTWYTAPIATRYTEWISTAEWHVVGATIGIPIALIIIAIAAYVLYIKRKMY